MRFNAAFVEFPSLFEANNTFQFDIKSSAAALK